MGHLADISAWIAFFIGLYALAAGAGELRAPGGWQRMIGEWEGSMALRFLTGLVCIAIGAAIYLGNPWIASDWLSVLVSVLGGLCAVEGALILASGDRVAVFARRLMGAAGTVWAGLSVALGALLVFAAISRIA